MLCFISNESSHFPRTVIFQGRQLPNKALQHIVPKKRDSHHWPPKIRRARNECREREPPRRPRAVLAWEQGGRWDLAEKPSLCGSHRRSSQPARSPSWTWTAPPHPKCMHLGNQNTVWLCCLQARSPSLTSLMPAQQWGVLASPHHHPRRPCSLMINRFLMFLF